MKWIYVLYCPDCFGEDPQGCFGGGFECSEETYDTMQEAEDAGEEATCMGIWDFWLEYSENGGETWKRYKENEKND